MRAASVRADAARVDPVFALALRVEVHAPALASERRRQASAARTIRAATARLAGLPGAVARAELVRAGGDAQLFVEDRALRGVTPRTRARSRIAELRADLLAALVARAHLVGHRQAVVVGAALRTKLALPTDAPLDARRSALIRLAVADLIGRHAARVARLAAEAAGV